MKCSSFATDWLDVALYIAIGTLSFVLGSFIVRLIRGRS